MDNDLSTTEWRKSITEKLEQALGNKKFCSNCQKHQSIESGIQTKYRWICKGCNEKRTPKFDRARK